MQFKHLYSDPEPDGSCTVTQFIGNPCGSGSNFLKCGCVVYLLTPGWIAPSPLRTRTCSTLQIIGMISESRDNRDQDQHLSLKIIKTYS